MEVKSYIHLLLLDHEECDLESHVHDPRAYMLLMYYITSNREGNGTRFYKQEKSFTFELP